MASWLGAECLRKFMRDHLLDDVRLNEFCEHVAELAHADNVPEWDNRAMKLDVDGMGNPLPVGLELVDALTALVTAVREISGLQIYGAFRPDLVDRELRVAIDIAGLDLAKYDVEGMSAISAEPEGFGPPIAHDVVRSFRASDS